MKIERASRKQAKVKISLAGSSGSGKSFSAIQLAYGLCNDYNKICIIDTENYSASLYSHLGGFNVINITPPFHPNKYIEAIQLSEQSGMEVIIIDNASHAWSGKGGCLDLHDREVSKMRVPNSFTAWAAVTPLYQNLIDSVVNSSCHIISTLRSKTEYMISERNGKSVPQKIGTSPMMRDGYDFEQTLAFDLDQNHKAFCTKDRTSLFADRDPFIISTETGKMILDWCNSGEIVKVDEVSVRINECKTVAELFQLYNLFPQYRAVLRSEYEAKKREIVLNRDEKLELGNPLNNSNGTH